MPSSPWHTLLIGRELHTCNSTCFFLTLHLAVSTEASAWLSTNDPVLFSTLTSGDAFVSNHKMGGGGGGGGEDRKHSADQMNSRWRWIIKSLVETHRGCTSASSTQVRIYKHISEQRSIFFFTPWDTNIAAQTEIPTHCREAWRGGMREEERKRELAQASVVTAISTKTWGSGREEGERKKGRSRRES